MNLLAAAQPKKQSEKGKGFLKIFYTLDIPLLLIVVGLGTIGVIFSYSSQIQIFETGAINPYNRYIKQFFYLLSGLILVWGVSLIPYRKLAEHSHIFYIGILAVLTFTLVLGTVVNQSRRWISLGGISLQPSEFAKIVIVVFTANYLDKLKHGMNHVRSLFILCALLAPVFGLIVLQPDLGTAIVFIPVVMIMVATVNIKPLYILTLLSISFLVLGSCFLLAYSENTAFANGVLQGVNYRRVLFFLLIVSLLFSTTLWIFNFRLMNKFLLRLSNVFTVIAFSCVLTYLTYDVLLKNYQKKRLLTFFNPYQDKWDLGYNVIQSQITIGSGKIWGKGLFKGVQSQLGFLPSKSTDFIFSIIAEELGFVGACLVILLIFSLLFRLAQIALRVKDYLGGLMVVGFLALFSIETFVNMGMTLGLVPVTGLPLPFLSSGGSTLWSSLIVVGIVSNIYTRRYIYS